MVSTATAVFCVLSLMASLILPLVLLILYVRKFRKQSIASAWLLGATGFFVTQILIRSPILTALQGQSWFLTFSRNHLFAYTFILAFSAGLFELAGRFTVAKLLQKNLTFPRGLAAGLGHGGIEAMVITGITYINNLLYIFLINTGTFDAMLAQSAAMGVDVTQLELVRTQLLTTSPLFFALGGFERILAMTCHAAMSLTVCYGVAHKRALPCLFVSLGIHTLIDLTAGLSLVLPQTIAYPIIYAILITAAVISLMLIRNIRCRWQNKEVFHDPEK